MDSFKRMVVVLYLTFQTLSTYAQPFNFVNYNSKDGLPSTEVYCTVQDSSGYIWFGTDAGVARFDGSNFTKFTTEDGLPDNTVLYMYVDHQGKIWMGSFSGGICYYFHDSIHTIAASDTLKKMISYGMDYINSICVDTNDRLWLGFSTNGGIVYLDKKDNYKTIVPFKLDSAFKHIWFVENRYPLFAGAMKYSNNRTIIVHYPGRRQNVPIDYTTTTSNRMRIYYASNGQLVFSYYDRLYLMTNGIISGPFKMPQMVTDIYIDKWGYIWVSLYRQGMRRYYRQISSVFQESFNGLTVTDCMYDKENGLWITTIEKGVFYIPSTLVSKTRVDVLSGPNITSLTFTDDYLYLTTGSGLIVKYEYDSVRKEFHYEKIVKATDYYIYTIRINGDKMIYGSNDLTISDLNANEDKVFRIGEKHIIIKDIFKTSNGHFLLAGLHYYVELDSEYNPIRYLNVPIRTHSVVRSTDGRTLLGTANGVWQLEKDSFKYLGSANFLLKHRTDDIMEDNDHNLWFVTREIGLIFQREGKYYLIDEALGLVSNQCSGIVQDKNGNIWVSTYEGLSKIFMNKGIPSRIENYTTYNGLNSNEVKSIYLFKDYLILVNSDGFDFFKYNDDLKNNTPPPIYIESILVDGSEMKLKDSVCRLDHTTKIIEFYFSSLTYSSLGNKRYRYKLGGYDKEWHYTNNNSVRYTNLPAGDYQFMVHGLNNNGFSSKEPSQVLFVVTLPWWKSGLFYVFIYSVSILTVLITSLVYTKNTKQKAKKAARIDYLLAESRLIALRAQMNPHFIFNVINSIQYYVLQNDKNKAYEYLASFSRLIRLVLDSSKYMMISLTKELDILRYYTELEKLRFGNELNVVTDVQIKKDLDKIMIPNMIIQPYVENAIVHGLLPKRNNTNLNISIIEQNKGLFVTITDNGIGRSRSMERKKTSSSDSTGMLITSERLKVIRTLSDVDVKVKITDLYDDSSNPIGTRIEIIIPIHEVT
jgi:ligand-binding sensor domain-containing protein